MNFLNGESKGLQEFTILVSIKDFLNVPQNQDLSKNKQANAIKSIFRQCWVKMNCSQSKIDFYGYLVF